MEDSGRAQVKAVEIAPPRNSEPACCSAQEFQPKIRANGSSSGFLAEDSWESGCFCELQQRTHDHVSVNDAQSSSV